jgi:hypothetical protein
MLEGAEEQDGVLHARYSPQLTLSALGSDRVSASAQATESFNKCGELEHEVSSISQFTFPNDESRPTLFHQGRKLLSVTRSRPGYLG